MSTTSTTIPAPVVAQLRGAAYQQLGSLAEDIAAANREPRCVGDEWTEPIARFDRTRALLARIGWCIPDREQDANVDLDRHRRAIVDALANDLEIMQSLESEPGDAAEGQRQRANAQTRLIEAFAESAGLDLLHDPERMVTVPDECMDVLAEALLERLRAASERVELADLSADAYPDALESFDAVRATLSAIGWGEIATFDASPHMDVLAETLTDRLETERGLAVDARSSTSEGNRRQAVRADEYAAQLETLSRLAGVEIPAAGESQ